MKPEAAPANRPDADQSDAPDDQDNLEDQDALEEPDPVLACRRRGMDLLARREHSRVELTRKLRARGFDAAVLGATLDGLEQDGLLADHRFAETFIRTRAGKGQGPVRIRAELATRGVAAADELVRDSGVDWFELAMQTRRKRFGLAAPDSYQERARQARFLHYRGFESDQIDAALDAADETD